MKKKVVIGLIATGLLASFCAGYYANNQPTVETMTTPGGQEDMKKTSQEEGLTEQENGKIVNNFQVQQPEAGAGEQQGNPQGDIVVKEEAPLPDVELVYNEETGIWEPMIIPGGEVDAGEGEGTGDTGDTLEGMTPEEIDKWMLDTSDAPKPGEKPQQPEGTQGNPGDQGQTGNENQGNTGKTPSGLTPEQQAELERILAEQGFTQGVPEGGGTGTPGGPGSINWN